MIEREAMVVLHKVGVEKPKLHNHFIEDNKVKAFLLKKIKAMVLQKIEDGVVAMRVGLCLEIDNHCRSTVIYHVVVRW